MGQVSDINEEMSATLKYARNKLREYKRLLSINDFLRYSSTAEKVDILINSSELQIDELETYLTIKSLEKTEIEITNKVNKLKENLERISSILVRSSLSILSAEDL